MPVDFASARRRLKSFDFTGLFVEELGWDCHSGVLDVQVDGQAVSLVAIAQKRGMAVYQCKPVDGGRIPDYPTRRKIDHQVTKSAREHLIVYADAAKTTQIWQWVKRELGKPTACRELSYYRGQNGDPLIQRLSAIAFSLDEEADLTLPGVVGQVRVAFDVEKVTKRFYDGFAKEHTAFSKFLKGIPDEHLESWYVSIMLNRLMFIYFIQKKGFLAGDEDYLRNRLAASKDRGKDRYYRDFLCPLFFEGFAAQEGERSAATNKLLGKVPYLNGGLFLRHQIEQQCGQTIQIPDAAFDRLFAFFDQYRWHLDERPLRDDREINPDVLGYIFEKYINQKQMGAYYTKEDITGYISRNTVIPFLFDSARPRCKIAFDGQQSIWGLLAADPDKYIYSAVRSGVIDDAGEVIPESALPEFVRKGMADPKARMFNKQYNLSLANIPGPDGKNLALPTETWREYVERRKRCLALREKLARGEVRQINDLITLNLDIQQFAQDVIQECEGPELLRAFWRAIVGHIPDKSNEKPEHGITVLDPTCGSGAFLFAALNILEPLYEACLDRMEVFVADLDRSAGKHRPEKFADFRRILAQVAEHPNRKYFIYKSIIVNNLFGVDIMAEAVEICKLRLFLKLVAQVEDAGQIEPLPDIDFNIRAGNTLVGYASLAEVRKVFAGQLGFADQEIKRIEEQAGVVELAFEMFRRMQTQQGMASESFAKAKKNLRDRLGELTAELDRHLAAEYGISAERIRNEKKREAAFAVWRKSHQPFHWLAEFYGIIGPGGFDVIVGNPPYVELSDVRDDYFVRGLTLTSTGNLYSLCIERCAALLNSSGRLGVIAPISAISTPRMLPLMQMMARMFAPLHLSNFAVRPGKLFVGVDMNLTVVLAKRAIPHVRAGLVYATCYNRWQDGFRPFLFANLNYHSCSLENDITSVPKLGSEMAACIAATIRSFPSASQIVTTASGADTVYYHSGGRYFRKCLREKLSNEYKELLVERGFGDAFVCLLSSSLYYWFWIAVSDCYHVTKRDIYAMPVPPTVSDDASLKSLAKRLLADLKRNARIQVRTRADGTQQREVNFRVGKSRAILDEIDSTLAAHYRLSHEQLDWIVNFDGKYRGGSDDD